MNLTLDYKPIESWDINGVENEPAIYCISGPYLDQLLFREVRNRSSKKMLHCSWGDHHHSHSTVYRSGIDLKKILKLIEDIKDDYKFKISKSLKFRKEKKGTVIAHGRNAYFINNIGSDLINKIRNIITIKDIRNMCKNQRISEQAGINFFKKLIIFEVLEWIPGE